MRCSCALAWWLTRRTAAELWKRRLLFARLMGVTKRLAVASDDAQLAAAALDELLLCEHLGIERAHISAAHLDPRALLLPDTNERLLLLDAGQGAVCIVAVLERQRNAPRADASLLTKACRALQRLCAQNDRARLVATPAIEPLCGLLKRCGDARARDADDALFGDTALLGGLLTCLHTLCLQSALARTHRDAATDLVGGAHSLLQPNGVRVGARRAARGDVHRNGPV